MAPVKKGSPKSQPRPMVKPTLSGAAAKPGQSVQPELSEEELNAPSGEDDKLVSRFQLSASRTGR
jgi:hypothetical protein